MARPAKTGFQRFSLDVHFLEDIRIRKAIKYKGGQAVLIYIKLLTMIYENGFFIKWDSELPFIVSESTGFDEKYIEESIEYLLDLGLFSRPMKQKQGILTSSGIQERYVQMCKNLKRNEDIPTELTLVSSVETAFNSEETGVITEETPIIPELSTQKSKVKKSKEEKRIDKSFRASDFPLPFDSNEFRQAWESFCQHRANIGSELTEQASKLVVGKLSKEPEAYAIAMIEKTVESGKWTSVYALKDWEKQRIDEQQKSANPPKRRYLNPNSFV